MAKLLEWLRNTLPQALLAKLDEDVLLALVALLWFAFAIVVAVAAHGRRQNGVGWFFFSLAITPIGSWYVLKAKLRELETETD